jgi:hypothetical protein
VRKEEDVGSSGSPEERGVRLDQGNVDNRFIVPAGLFIISKKFSIFMVRRVYFLYKPRV